MLSRTVVTQQLTDPLSGFFMIRRETFHRIVRRLSGEGYKILLDLFASSPEPLRFIEVPYIFRERTAGASKLDAAVVWEYVLLIVDKQFGHIVPARFILFSFVGLSGVVVHFLALATAFKVFSVDFPALITASATLYPFSLAHCLPRRAEGSRRYLNRCQDCGKHGPGLLPEKPLRCGRPIRTREKKIVHRC
jgi:dolichol-phosphate mannosyltransferase